MVLLKSSNYLQDIGTDSKDQLLCVIDPTNIASERVAEKVGFERGDLLKEPYQRASEVRDGIFLLRYCHKWHLQRPKGE